MVCHKHFEEFGNIHKLVAIDVHDLVKVEGQVNACPNKNEHGHWCRECQARSRVLHDRLREREAMCPECNAARAADAARTQAEDTIDPSQPWGEHILLTCLNHPELRWTTKNISYIGARSIFYQTIGRPECPCSARDLV